MSEAGLVSVVIPAYNRAHTVARCVDSVLSQTHPQVEAIVVDDGSRDNTAEVMKRYAGDRRVRYVPKENGGVSTARNRGMRESRGEFMALLDSDDWWFADKLDLQVKILREFPQAGMVWTDMQAVDKSGKVLKSPYLREMYHAFRFFPRYADMFAESRKLRVGALGEVTVYSGDIFGPMSLGSLVHTSTCLMRTDRMRKVGEFREDWRIGEDYDYHLRTCREGPVAFADAVTTNYQIGEADQLTVNSYSKLIASRFIDVMERNFREYGARIQLPDWMVRECKIEAYAWAAESALETHKMAEARRFAFQSLRLKPRQPRQLRIVMASLLPAGAWALARRALGKN